MYYYNRSLFISDNEDDLERPYRGVHSLLKIINVRPALKEGCATAYKQSEIWVENAFEPRLYFVLERTICQ
jgi:hypothetical protein